MRTYYALLFIVAAAFAGCSGSTSGSPTAPSAVSSSPAAQSVQLHGFVLDTGFRTLSGARIEVVDGPSAGTSVLSGDDGQFVVSGTFNAETRFRATKDGHESRTQPWNCSVAVCLGAGSAQPWLGFYLSVAEPTANIAGNYVMTVTADTACASTLPELARNRTYRVLITPQSVDGRSTIPGFYLGLDGVSTLGMLSGFQIGAAGNHMSMWLDGRHDPSIVEDLGNNTYLAFSGTADVDIADAGVSTINATFDGWIEQVTLTSPLQQWYFPLPPLVSRATCDSTHHRITLARAN